MEKRKGLKALPIFALIVASLLTVGCQSKPSAPGAVSGTNSAHYPARPSTPPPAFKVFHHDAGTFTLVTKDNATDPEIEAIIWQLRDATHAHTLDKISISEKATDDHKPTIWFHIYRGSKCASEKYAPGAPPCGGSYHAAGDYTFGSSANPNWDDGILRNAAGQELPLWDSDAPYKPPAS